MPGALANFACMVSQFGAAPPAFPASEACGQRFTLAALYCVTAIWM